MSNRAVIAQLSSLLAFGLWLGVSACDSGGGPLPLGAACVTSAQCESGICGGNECLDPEGDKDQDGLLNKVEASLKTDPADADSDGDGTGDMDEIGDILAPPDSDGDGKIDAIESDKGDKDGDCIPDQSDPRDGYADPPSEEFPNACGGQEDACGPSPLDGTCAEAVGQMVYECFAPKGGCRVVASAVTGGPASIEWDNGASIEWASVDGVTTGLVRSGDGTLCGTIDQLAGEETAATAAPMMTITVGAEGPTFWVTEVGEEIQIMCPSEEVVVLDEGEADTFAECAGLTVGATCEVETPQSCVMDADCMGEGICCPISAAQPEAGKMCMPVEVCPQSEQPG